MPRLLIEPVEAVGPTAASADAGLKLAVRAGHYPADRHALPTQWLALRAAKGNRSVTLRRLFFDESAGREDVEPPADEEVAEKDDDGTHRRPPTYLRPFARRPGQWGVFHVLTVKLGAGTPRLVPRGLERARLREQSR